MRFLVDAHNTERELLAGERLVEVAAADRSGTSPAS
jgi:hypothetical protein